MRIAWVVPYPVYGGPHNHVHRIAPHLRRLGVETCVVVPDEAGNACARLSWEPALDVATLPLHRLRATRQVRPHVDLLRLFGSETTRLARLFRDRQVDVVVQATLLPPHAAVAARLAHLPLICQIVDTRAPRAVTAFGMTFVRHFADRAMFCGEPLIAWHTGNRPLPIPTEIFYPPVDTQWFVPSEARRKTARLKWGIPADAPVVGMVGNLNPQKGWEYFVRAAAIIHRELPSVRFLMVGASYAVHAGYLATIDREIDCSGVPRERFIRTGDSNDVASLLTAMDVKMITSTIRSEGTPTSGLEALACGVPVVGVDVGAVSAFVQDGETGFLVEALNSAAIAAAAIRVLTHPELRARMGTTGRQLAVRKFDVRTSAAQHCAAFDEARKHHRARTTA